MNNNVFLKTKKEAPKDETAINAKLLIKGGFIEKLASGIYLFLPLGWRVHQKIERIIREEMNRLGAREIFLSALQPVSLWKKERIDSMKDILYRLYDSSKREFLLGPTHEEIISMVGKVFIKSFRDLPFSLYQIQTKFRDEPRAKSGLLRTREFIMKDLYSFHSDKDDMEKFYQKVKNSYLRIFKRCGLKVLVCEASGGAFSKEYSHEFMVRTEAGEDKVIFCKNCNFAQNFEISSLKENQVCPKCKKEKLKMVKTIEVGNIFKLGTKFSEMFDIKFIDRDQKEKFVWMACYGIGVGRLMGAVVEVSCDKQGIIWPKEIAPFLVHLITLKSGERKIDKRIEEFSKKSYQTFLKEKIEVLLDQRDISPGEKFFDYELIGCPFRIVISKKTVQKNKVEIRKRKEKEPKLVSLSEAIRILKS
ncbi:hypothetical protein J7J41_00825 [bacterium]|nr:hypothetical protein [bacterium]